MKTLKQDTKDFIDNKIVDISKICCADVECSVDGNDFYDNKFVARYVLKTKFSMKEYDVFLKNLDFHAEEFDYVYGRIWFKDGSWAYYEPIIDEEPELYGYSWHLYICPSIPEECKRSE